MTDHTAHHITPGGSLVGRVAHRIWQSLVEMVETTQRAQLLRALCEMSDAELAQRGMRRDTIVRQVFNDARDV